MDSYRLIGICGKFVVWKKWLFVYLVIDMKIFGYIGVEII